MPRTSLTSLLCGAASVLAVASAADLRYGEVITKCTEPNSIALTFDDGPHKVLTPELLKTLKNNGVKATFFVNGENYNNVANEGALLKQMLADGHQIGSHTYNHKNLADSTKDEVRNQMSRLDKVLQEKIGMSPVFMRPPFFATSEAALQVLAEMKYHVINADIDTKDYENKTPDKTGQAVQNFKDGLARGGSITLMHDVHENTIEQLVPAILPLIKNKKAVTVGECLGVPQEKWYRGNTPENKPSASSSSSSAGSIPTSSVVSGVPSVSLSKTKQSTSPVVIRPTAPSAGSSLSPPIFTASSAPWANGTRSTSTSSSSVEMTTSTVYTTSVQTVTSCPPAVVSCPARVATVTVPLYTTICPVDAVATSTAKPGSEAITSVETRTAKVTKIRTITKCPPSVVNCPVGSITTEVSSTTYCPGQQCGLPTGPAQPAAPKDGSDKKTPNNDGKVPSNKGSDKVSVPKVECPSAAKDGQTPKNGAGSQTPSQGSNVPVAKPSSVGGKESGVKPSSPVPGKVHGGQGRNATVAGAAKPSASAAAPSCLGASCPNYQASKSSDHKAVTGAGAASFGIGAAPVVVGAILAMLIPGKCMRRVPTCPSKSRPHS